MSLSTEEIIGLNKEYTMFEWSMQGGYAPWPVDHAKGVYVWDTNGKRYLDFNSQLMSVNIGHGDQRVIKAITDQLNKLAYVNPYAATESRGVLGKLLADITPGNLKKSFFTLGGSEANENAVKIARIVSGKHKVLARYRSYHGGTALSMGLTGDPRRWASEPQPPGIKVIRPTSSLSLLTAKSSPRACCQPRNSAGSIFTLPFSQNTGAPHLSTGPSSMGKRKPASPPCALTPAWTPATSSCSMSSKSAQKKPRPNLPLVSPKPARP